MPRRLPHQSRMAFGYPTITRGVGLPKGGIRAKGLQPDVQVRWETVADPVGYVIRALGK